MRHKIAKRNEGRQVKLELLDGRRGIGTLERVNRGGGCLWATVKYHLLHRDYGTVLPDAYTMICGKRDFWRITLV